MNYSPANLSNETLGKHRDSYMDLDKQVKAGDSDVKANLDVYSAYLKHGILVINRELKRRAVLDQQKLEEKCQDDMIKNKLELNCSSEFSLDKLRKSYDEEIELISAPIRHVVMLAGK
jgi:hypothetical protein